MLYLRLQWLVWSYLLLLSLLQSANFTLICDGSINVFPPLYRLVMSVPWLHFELLMISSTFYSPPPPFILLPVVYMPNPAFAVC